jgi:nucleoside 2-deoxyribosyltransferase
MRIYWAGPLFTAAERLWNQVVVGELRSKGHEIWLPQEQQQDDLQKVFENCIAGINWCEAVVACMDGSDPESGTCGECGYAYRKRPILAYRTDFRQGGEAGGAGYNLVLAKFATYCLDLRVAAWSEPIVPRIATMIHNALVSDPMAARCREIAQS